MSDVGTEGGSESAGAGLPESADADARDARDDTEPPRSEETELDHPDPEVESGEPDDAFGALGNEVRMAVLRALADPGTGSDHPDAGRPDTERSDAGRPDTERSDAGRPHTGREMTFSDLFEASPADTTAGFAYHLRQLADRFVEKTDPEATDADEAYALTDAGRRVARAVRAGTFTDRVSFGPVPTGDACPLCEAGDLEATCEANDVAVACTDCGRTVLSLPFPPGARQSRDPEELLAAFDRHHRHRLSTMSDGVCPECAATMDASLARPPDAVTERLPDAGADRAQVRLDCAGCGYRLHCPVTLAVLEHPGVVAFFHDHGLNVRDRPVWNVGPEWSEAVVDDDPWCVRVGCELGGEVLDVFVRGDCSVAGTRRRDADAGRQAS